MAGKNYIYYSLGITCFSPTSNLYQITRLYNLNFTSNLRLLGPVLLPQSILRYSQLHFSEYIKSLFSPWLAFGAIGVLQGGIYGHANHYFSHRLGLPLKTGLLKSVFRGSPFAANRDIVSQGIPFMITDKYQNQQTPLQYWSLLIGSSISSTYLSHPLHNCQVLLQTNSNLSYSDAIRELVKNKSYFKGAESRIGLLLVTNIFNELFLKPVWK